MPNRSCDPEVRLILSAGMQRSGSTWLYNVARFVLEQNLGGEDFWSGWIEDRPPGIAKKAILVKMHNFDADQVAAAHVILYCYRDIRDVLASAYRTWGIPPSLDMADALVDQFNHWMPAQNCLVRYDEMMSRPDLAIKRIAAALGHEVDVPEVKRQLAGLSYDSPGPRSKEHHLVNLFHPNHITDGRHETWHGCVAPELVAAIEHRHAEWFSRHGYL